MHVSGDHQTSSLQQEQHKNTVKQYALVALKQAGHSSCISLVEYDSVIKMVEYLRHRNPDCGKTIVTYLGFLSSTLKTLNNTTPDNLVRVMKEADEDQLEAMFLDLDDHWLEACNSTATRKTKWAALKTFLVANNVKKAQLIKCNIRNRRKIIDYSLTREDCRKVLDAAKTTNDKLTVALLIESMQRIGTITLLTWGDVQPHLDKNEDIFLLWIDAQRTKCNIEHWSPIGPLSAYYMRKHLAELREKGIEVSSEDILIANQKRHSVNVATIAQQIQRIMMRAGVVGKKQGQGHMTRYEKHVHSFRKFGKVEMQRNKVNEDVINYLMGHKRDTYTEWGDKYDELLEIYKEARPQIDQERPRLDQKEALDDILEYAKIRGYSLDPKYLQRMENGNNTSTCNASAIPGEIRVDSNPHPNNSEGAEATTAFRSSQR